MRDAEAVGPRLNRRRRPHRLVNRRNFVRRSTQAEGKALQMRWKAIVPLLCTVLLAGCAGTSTRGLSWTPTPSPTRSSETPYVPPTVIYQVEGTGEAAVSYSTSDGITSETYTLDGDTLDVWTGSPAEAGTLIMNVLSLEVTP